MIEDLVHMKPGEKVIYSLRRHPIIFVGDVLLILILVAAPLGLYFGIGLMWPELLSGPISGPVLILTASAYYFLVWLFFMMNFVDYYLDLWIVTNDRVLNVEQHSLFSRTISELDLANVQDVTSEVKGVLAFVFGYGNVYIQTAAEKGRFVFEQVHDPEEIRKNMLEIVSEDRKREGWTPG